MAASKYQIDVPAAAVEELNLDLDQPIDLKVENQKIVIEQHQDEPESQVSSIRWFLIPSVLATLTFIGYFEYLRQVQIKLTGDNSIASAVIVLGVISGLLSFVFFFVRGKIKHVRSSRHIYWRHFPTILVAIALILAIVLIGLFWIVGILFSGASFDRWTAAVIFFTFASIINYSMVYLALVISPGMIIGLLMSVILGGVLASMVANSTLQWWQINLSFLGTSRANNAWQFNLTLMVSALLMIALIDYLFVSLRHTNFRSRRLTILRWLLTLTAVNLGLIGFFPNNGRGQLHWLHDQAAYFLVYMIIILIIGIRWLLPKVTKEFLGISYLVGVFLVISDVLFQPIGYFSLTSFELIAFFLSFSWIMLVIQNLQRLNSTSTPSFRVKLRPTE